jgi:hypothetical protein
MINEKALIENLSIDKELKQPKRYTAAGEGAVRADEKGVLVLLSDYEKLLRFTAILDRHEEVQYKQREAFEKLCKELKAEVEELKSQPDPLTAYLYADTLRRDEIKTLKAHIELLTYVGDAMAMMVGHIEVKGDAHRMMLEFSKEWNAAKEGKAK